MTEPSSSDSTPARTAAGGYLAAREAAGGAGLTISALDAFGAIQREQWQLYQQDQRDSLRRFAETLNPWLVWSEHLARRAQHVGQGTQRWLEAADDVAGRGQRLHRDLWARWPTGPGAVNNSRPAVLDRLRTDHRRLRRVLDTMQTLIARAGDLRAHELEVLVTCVDYIAEYPDAVHHPLEDRMCACLLESDDSPAVRELVAGLEAGHLELADATARLLDDVNTLLTAGHPVPATLAAHAERYIALQRGHMEMEETHLFPVAQRAAHMLAQREHHADGDAADPLFDDTATRFDDLYRFITDPPHD